MSLMSIFEISGSAMSAQSVRLNATASNMANANSAAATAEQVYRARHPVFSTIHASALGASTADAFAADRHFDARGMGYGVQVLGIIESNAPHQQRYEPEHPLADQEGYVYYPNVNIVEEMTNMISSSRAFQVNVDVMNATKTMAQRVLSLGQ
jgi:flagellar basal-body rod protein FlgC